MVVSHIGDLNTPTLDLFLFLLLSLNVNESVPTPIDELQIVGFRLVPKSLARSIFVVSTTRHKGSLRRRLMRKMTKTSTCTSPLTARRLAGTMMSLLHPRCASQLHLTDVRKQV
jgi:hypothetical protein